jgi:cytochrome c553
MIRRLIGAAAIPLLLAASSTSAADGAATYEEKCAKCHGKTGLSDTTIGKAKKVPALAGDEKVQKMSVSEIVAVMKANKKHPPNIKSLSDDDMTAAAGYAKQLAGGGK